MSADNLTTELELLLSIADEIPDHERERLASQLERAARRLRVTYSRKRYIIKCTGCEKLAEVSRKDATTCSPACRVAAHRNGSSKALRDKCKVIACGDPDLTPGLMARVGAAWSLAPDVSRRLVAGTADIGDAEVVEEIARRFDMLAMEEAMAEIEADE